MRDSRRALRAARGGPAPALLEGTDGGDAARDRRRRGARRRRAAPAGARPALPIDVARTVEELLGTRRARLRARPRAVRAEHLQRRAAPLARAERRLVPLLQRAAALDAVARRFVESFFGRLDARTASLPATAELMSRHFPGDYRLVADDERRCRASSSRSTATLAAPPPPGRGRPRAARARSAQRPLIDVDLHMHTDHSHDCATPVEVLLATAREQGLGAIAVTDHNEISGALEARAAGGARPASR